MCGGLLTTLRCGALQQRPGPEPRALLLLSQGFGVFLFAQRQRSDILETDQCAEFPALTTRRIRIEHSNSAHRDQRIVDVGAIVQEYIGDGAPVLVAKTTSRLTGLTGLADSASS